MPSLIFFWLACMLYETSLHSATFLVFGGANGWIGKKMVALIEAAGHTAHCARARLENRESIIAEIVEIKPDYIINAATLTGNPTIVWCQTHQQETIRTNLLGALTLADTAFIHNIHVTNLSPGCLYTYNATHTTENGSGFSEEEPPNVTSFFYTQIKIQLEKLLHHYPNVLHLRIHLPISTELDQGFFSRLIAHKKASSTPTSLCVLDDMLPIALDMALHKRAGVYNFVNRGTIAPCELLALYKKYIDPLFEFEVLQFERDDPFIKTGHSYAHLNVEKLNKEYPALAEVKNSVVGLFKRNSLC